MELWELGFAAGIVAVFTIFTVALAFAQVQYDRSKH